MSVIDLHPHWTSPAVYPLRPLVRPASRIAVTSFHHGSSGSLKVCPSSILVVAFRFRHSQGFPTHSPIASSPPAMPRTVQSPRHHRSSSRVGARHSAFQTRPGRQYIHARLRTPSATRLLLLRNMRIAWKSTFDSDWCRAACASQSIQDPDACDASAPAPARWSCGVPSPAPTARACAVLPCRSWSASSPVQDGDRVRNSILYTPKGAV